MPKHIFSIITLFFAGFAGAQNTDAFTSDRFDREVRPILSDKCYICHGPDAATRKAGLRLDTEEGAYAKAIDQTSLSESPLLHRILTDDPSDQMPPPESNLSLTDQERDTLVAWVEAGAPWAKHWSFRPVTKPTPPTPWPVHPIDAFVRDRLKEEGIAPSPLADTATLVRRLYLDLTGLPPQPHQLEAILSQDDPGIIAEVTDNLLASPAFGEHFARQWLDVARYADTYGYQNDRESNLWPYRDWVIEAFNRNLPYDEFVRQQLAGDLIPLATQDQRLATAFNRLHRQTNEGGSVLEEFRVEYVSDRVETFGTAFLGLTLGCARCHDHKYDPISQKNYYELSAFFDDIDESGMYSHFTSPTPTPAMPLYNPGQKVDHENLKRAITRAEGRVTLAGSDARGRLRRWIEEPLEDLKAPRPDIALDFEEVAENKTPNASDEEHPASLSLAPQQIPGPAGQGILFDGDNSITARGADYERTDAFSLALWLRMAETLPHQVVIHRTQAAEDAANRGYALALKDGKPTFTLAHFWPGDAIQVQALEGIPVDTWQHVAVTYDGSSRADGVALYVNGIPVEATVIRDKLTRTIRYEGGGPAGVILGSRFRDVGFKDGAVDQVRVYPTTLSPLVVRGLARNHAPEETLRVARTFRDLDALLPWYLREHDTMTTRAREKLAEARVEEHTFITKIQSIMVMEDMAEPRQAYLLNRGQYNDRGEPVYPSTPEAILPFSEDYPKNRMGLAEWLLDPENPLTARVAVNRIWRNFFGEGIVKTQEDFGNQGSGPSHPALLDYLAAHFVESGWDVKALCRFIVSSATYQQSAAYRPELQDRDPENRLLAGGPAYRLDAEVIRDSALAASGLLVPKIGGPSVKPVQPPGLWKEAGSLTYAADEGDARHRRSLYTFWKRTVPPPNMLTFDAQNREVCTARRERTTTPLQALVLLNDPQFVEAARALAERAQEDFPEDDAGRVRFLYAALSGNWPDDREVELLQQALDEQRRWYAERPDAALAYAGMPQEADPDADRAATVAVAQALMSFDAFQVRR